ncbi:Uncharacterized protein APZ42_034156 [Daphnia magna]|uniref:MULE transposase domain-containing protein n=1 Tax=Daphnia magna TaxID=35525 RepID=A0A164KDZ4_9CRUS|nr:Uncharacterized protein APZ42_034156 [Daphnia magna]
MSLSRLMVKGKSFDSHNEILKCIKEIELQDHVYLRRGTCQTVKSYNNRKDVHTKLDPIVEFYRVECVCPHNNSGSRLRPTLDKRPNQNTMACDCPVRINLVYDKEKGKFVIRNSVLEHKNHPISAEHVKTYARKRHMVEESLEFAKQALAVGAQPTRLRGLLLKKYDFHLISRDLINLKQSLTGNDEDEWQNTVTILRELEEENQQNIQISGEDNKGNERSKNVVQVVHEPNGEIHEIYLQTESQRKLYSKIGTVLEMDGTYGTNNVGFSLYHLLCEDNNSESQPGAHHHYRYTEIAAMEQYFPKAEHILCHFHIIKSVDDRLNKKVDGKGLTQQYKDEIREHFRNALYAETEEAYNAEKKFLLKQGEGEGSLSSYFQLNWFNIESKWTSFGRRHLPTLGNNTTNPLERFHHTIKVIFLKTKRLDLVICHLLDNIKLRMTERKLKQRIRELRFTHKKTNPLFDK